MAVGPAEGRLAVRESVTRAEHKHFVRLEQKKVVSNYCTQLELNRLMD